MVTQLQATMGNDLKVPSDIAISEEISNYGRRLTQNERACALSHTSAREIISKSEFGGVILEDDARIINLENFYSLSVRFLLRNQKKRKILSLVNYFSNKPENKSQIRPKSYFRLLSHAPLAVAAAITPKAAKQLLKNSKKNSAVADWPGFRCVFYILNTGVVNHGDAESESIIGNVGFRVEQGTINFTSKKDIIRITRKVLQKIDTYRIRNIQD
jgi:GR25 family glycosyltransferase involved in LPS biosynthesis